MAKMFIPSKKTFVLYKLRNKSKSLSLQLQNRSRQVYQSRSSENYKTSKQKFQENNCQIEIWETRRAVRLKTRCGIPCLSAEKDDSPVTSHARSRQNIVAISVFVKTTAHQTLFFEIRHFAAKIKAKNINETAQQTNN